MDDDEESKFIPLHSGPYITALPVPFVRILPVTGPERALYSFVLSMAGHGYDKEQIIVLFNSACPVVL